jgi:hypothetical protein
LTGRYRVPGADQAISFHTYPSLLDGNNHPWVVSDGHRINCIFGLCAFTFDNKGGGRETTLNPINRKRRLSVKAAYMVGVCSLVEDNISAIPILRGKNNVFSI